MNIYFIHKQFVNKMMEHLPEEIVNMRPKVVEYIMSKINNKELSIEIEDTIFNTIIKKFSLHEIKIQSQIFRQLYNYQLCMFINNNKELCEKINKELTPFDIFNGSPFDIFSKNWEESKKRKLQEEKFLYETTQRPNCTEICLECNQQNIYAERKQIRGSDEPETLFYKCLNPACATKWVV